ncbi:hypothetical protein Ancab_029209 [Ancistrocladus abbreviatus]
MTSGSYNTEDTYEAYHPLHLQLTFPGVPTSFSALLGATDEDGNEFSRSLNKYRIQRGEGVSEDRLRLKGIRHPHVSYANAVSRNFKKAENHKVGDGGLSPRSEHGKNPISLIMSETEAAPPRNVCRLEGELRSKNGRDEERLRSYSCCKTLKRKSSRIIMKNTPPCKEEQTDGGIDN